MGSSGDNSVARTPGAFDFGGELGHILSTSADQALGEINELE